MGFSQLPWFLLLLLGFVVGQSSVMPNHSSAAVDLGTHQFIFSAVSGNLFVMFTYVSLLLLLLLYKKGQTSRIMSQTLCISASSRR
jgi:ABC-type Na+ efflux pump permease subunit